MTIAGSRRAQKPVPRTDEVGMAKRCGECSSVVNDEAPYCESCGSKFTEKSPPIRVERWNRTAVLSYALAAAILYLLVSIMRKL